MKMEDIINRYSEMLRKASDALHDVKEARDLAEAHEVATRALAEIDTLVERAIKETSPSYIAAHIVAANRPK